jgi:hypothetical protein
MSSETEIAEHRDRKLIKRRHNGEEFILGYVGSIRVGQIVLYGLQIPDNTERTPLKYMINRFAETVARQVASAGITRRDIKEEDNFTILVGYRSSLFLIHDDFRVGERADSFEAIGTGGQVALGVMSATEGEAPRVRLRKALTAAEKFASGVRRPFIFVTTRIPE